MSNSLSITKVTDQLTQMPKYIARARKAALSWNLKSWRLIKRNPGRALLGAVAAGFVLSTLTRRS